MKSFFGRLKSEIKKSGWPIVIVYFFIIVSIPFKIIQSGILGLRESILFLVVIIILDFINRFFKKFKKNDQKQKSPLLNVVFIIIALLKIIFVISVGLGLIFLPDVGPIGVPWSFALAIGVFIYAAHIFYLFRDIKQRDKFGIFWCCFLLIFYPFAIYVNDSLSEKGVKDMKLFSINIQEMCNIDKKCKNLEPPWTKDYKNIKIKNNSFKIYITHLETYHTFTGGVNQDLLLEIQNLDIDYEGKNKKIFKYSENKWMPVK